MAYGDAQGGSGGNKKKAAIIGVSSILLVAMVVAVAVGVSRNGGDVETGSSGGSTREITTSNKAITALCQPTDYKDTCEKSLSSAAGNTTDPKELIRVAFNVAVQHIGEAMKNSTVLQEASKDPYITEAFKTCQELLDYSIMDLQKSFDKLGAFELSKMDSYIADLKTWLSGAITYQQTCLDGFENTTTDSGEQMKKLLQLSGELTSNGLSMVNQIGSIFSSLKIPGMSRRLLADEAMPLVDGFPQWVGAGKRRLLQTGTPATPDAIVALDGSGTFKTITEALKTVPKNNAKPFVIYIKEGVYNEYVEVTNKMTNVVLIGDGPTRTKITGSRSRVGGWTTFKSSTVTANGAGFVAKDLGIENTAGHAKHQAVALRVSSDMAVIYNCQIDGYQDTLYAHNHRQFYRDCTISGTIDFIFGDAVSVFQNCKFIVKMPGPDQSCMVTAQGRHDHGANTGIVLQNCIITGTPELAEASPPVKVYLGRPWKEFSRTIIMDTEIDSLIDPEGWAPWAGTIHLDTLYYAEINNRGPGSDKSKRVTWSGIKNLTPSQAAEFSPGRFLRADEWIPQTAVPFTA